MGTIARRKKMRLFITIAAWLLLFCLLAAIPLCKLPMDKTFVTVRLALFAALLGATLALARLLSDRLPHSLAIKPARAAGLCLALGVVFCWMNHDYVKGISGYIACTWSDPTAYFIQARMFAAGHLSAPSPPYPECFESEHCVIYNGRFFGKYPPGWPAVLAVGLKTGLQWTVNPFLTITALFMLFLFVRRFFNPEAALIAFLFASPSAIVHWGAKGYFSEPLALLSATVFLYCSFRALLEPKWAWSVPAGAALGVMFLTRPFTAFVLCVPMCGFWIIRSIRDRGALARGAVLAASAFPFFLLHLAYNQYLTGSMGTFPHSLYNMFDKLGFGLRSMDNCIAPVYYGLKDVPRNLFRQLLDVAMIGVPLAPLLFAALLLKPVRKIEFAMIAIAVCLVGFQGLYHCATVRYHMPIMAAITAGCAAGLIKAARLFVGARKAPAAAVVAAISLSVAYTVTVDIPIAYDDSVKQKSFMDPFITVKKKGLTNAIVAMRSTPRHGTFARFYTQNAPDFRNDVIFVNDCGRLDSLHALHYPDRSVYYYDYDSVAARGILTPAPCPTRASGSQETGRYPAGGTSRP